MTKGNANSASVNNWTFPVQLGVQMGLLSKAGFQISVIKYVNGLEQGL